MRIRIVLIVCLMALSTAELFAQGTLLPFGNDAYHYIDRWDIKYGKVLPIFHTSVKPYSRKHLGEFADSIEFSNVPLSKWDKKNFEYLKNEVSEWVTNPIKSKKVILKYFYREPANFFQVDKENFVFRVNPVGNYVGAGQVNDTNYHFLNTRGAEFRASIYKKLSFYSVLTDNQGRPPMYFQDWIEEYEAVPGEGFFKEFRDRGVDFFTARGYMTFNVLDHVDIQLGHDKNFIGNGYRSLFLSDFSANYFYLKMDIRVWRIHYQSLFTELAAQYDRGLDKLLDKKYAVFHHLNFNLTHWLDIGLFEGVVFVRENIFELQYLNPIIFYRFVEQQLGSPDNSVLGLDFKANIWRRFSLYGQFMLDEFNFNEIASRSGWWANKFGLQFGLKYIDVAEVENLDLQFETNIVRPFTYTHTRNYANYTHYNQPLAHPWGANFKEFIYVFRYQPWRDIRVKMTVIHGVRGLDAEGSNWGSDVFEPTVFEDGSLAVEQEFGNKIGQGEKTNIQILDFIVSYQARHNVYLDFQAYYRNQNSDYDDYDRSDIYFGLGVRLNYPYRTYNF